MSKFIFYKVWDAYDIEDMRAGVSGVNLSNFKRRCDPVPEELLQKFEKCKEELAKRNELLREMNQPLIDDKFCKTDFETYSFENMIQLLRKIYSGYIYYEVSDLAVTPSSRNVIALFDIFGRNNELVGVVEERSVEDKISESALSRS